MAITSSPPPNAQETSGDPERYLGCQGDWEVGTAGILEMDVTDAK